MNGKGRKKKALAPVVIIGVLSVLVIVSAVGCGSCSCVISQPTGSSSESLRPDSSEELTETDEGSASSDEETDDSTDEGTESIEPSESEESSESETEVESETESEDSTDESSSERETIEGSHSSSSEPTTKPTQVSHSETPTVTPTVAPTVAPHQHTWTTEQVLVSAAYDEQVVVTPAYDDVYYVGTYETYDPNTGQTVPEYASMLGYKVLLPDKNKPYSYTVPYNWDENIYEVHSVCNFPGCNYDYTAYTRAHNCSFDEALNSHISTPENLAQPPELMHGGWHRENVLVNVIHHTTASGTYMPDSYGYKNIFEIVHHDAVTNTVHHDAVYKTVRKCTVCGKIEE